MNMLKVESLKDQLEMVNSPIKTESLSRSSFSLTSGPQTDLYNSADGEAPAVNMPMALMNAAENFVLTAKVNPAFSEKFDAGSIVLYADQDHWVKFLYEKDFFDRTIVGSAVTNVFTDDNIHQEINQREIYLRMSRRDGLLVSLYISLDGKQWQYLRVFRLPEGIHWKVGFGSQSPMGAGCQVIFSEVTYEERAYTDFWTGS